MPLPSSVAWPFDELCLSGWNKKGSYTWTFFIVNFLAESLDFSFLQELENSRQNIQNKTEQSQPRCWSQVIDSHETWCSVTADDLSLHWRRTPACFTTLCPCFSSFRWYIRGHKYPRPVDHSVNLLFVYFLFQSSCLLYKLPSWLETS